MHVYNAHKMYCTYQIFTKANNILKLPTPATLPLLVWNSVHLLQSTAHSAGGSAAQSEGGETGRGGPCGAPCTVPAAPPVADSDSRGSAGSTRRRPDGVCVTHTHIHTHTHTHTQTHTHVIVLPSYEVYILISRSCLEAAINVFTCTILL